MKFYVGRGYACLSINWGGREMDNARPDDPNTDWGPSIPRRKMFRITRISNRENSTSIPASPPRNNNWYLLTLGSRRGLTFLEREPEVDPDRLGVYGHSMGGNLTMYVAGTDRRVKVAALSVGGQGFRTMPLALLSQQRSRHINGDL